MRYVLDFGSANAGKSPAWMLFVRTDTLADVAPHPTFTEIGSGEYYFDYEWAAAPTGVESISFKATCGGIELSDVIDATTTTAGTATVSPGTTSTYGFKTAGELINRAAIQVGLAKSLDPVASTDANFVQMVEFLNSTGEALNSAYDWRHFIRVCVFATSGGATSYALPADFQQMIPETGWNRSQRLPLLGPLTAQETETVRAQLTGVILNTPWRLLGNLLEFTKVPPDSQTIAFEYISNYWVQSATSTTGPDKDAVTASTDVVLYDPLLIVRALKFQFLQAHLFDTSAASREYDKQLEYAILKNGSARTLHAGGGRIIDRYLDRPPMPVTGYGS